MFCASCGSPNDDTARFCHKCGASVGGVTPPAPPGPDFSTMRGGPTSTSTTVVKQYATGKNAAVAMILSLIVVGVGQFYNGDMKKGGIMLGAAVIFGALTAGLGWLAIAIWSAVDAYQVASGKSPMW
jgi:TM2 domain-containing membrane protein YozV